MAVPPLLVATRHRVDAAFTRANSLSAADIEIQADFAKYLCVLVSGLVEVAISEFAIQHCQSRSAPTVHAYAASQLDRLQNIKAERLLQVVGAFDPAWRGALEKHIAGQRRDALDSVIDLRNKIAHGEQIGLTLHRIKNYYTSVSEIIDFLEQQFA
jgi:hypothetical protein